MHKIKARHVSVGIFIVLSFFIKLIMILVYKNQLTLSSDDLNYIKSADVLLKKGIFTFHNFNEPTVFIMPLYPVFLSVVFKLFGLGLAGLQAVRIIQAIFSSITILAIYFTANKLFDYRIALLSAFFTAFYIPNITTTGYILTETLFTMLFMILILTSLHFIEKPSNSKYAILGVLWALVTLCRPTIALYPILLAVYYYFYKKIKIKQLAKLSIVMMVSFVVIMSPWWIRNFKEYGEFIPLAAASGNPMLQGTYIDYIQSSDNIAYYKLGKNAYETNKIEVETAKKRIAYGFQKNFWGYLNWYTVKKTILYWCGTFYWKEVFGINKNIALVFHYILLLGIPGIIVAFYRNWDRFLLPVTVIVYFNAIHCAYMAFDRYAFPLMALISIFSSYFIITAYSGLKRRNL